MSPAQPQLERLLTFGLVSREKRTAFPPALHIYYTVLLTSTVVDYLWPDSATMARRDGQDRTCPLARLSTIQVQVLLL